VDDLPHCATSEELLTWFEAAMRKEFGSLTATDLDWVLGISIDYDRDAGTCTMTQRQYIEDQCRALGLENEPTVATPALANFSADPPTDETALTPAEQKQYMSIIGGLNYVQKQTRLDVAAIISILAQFLSRASKAHMKQAKRVWVYLRDTADHTITYRRQDAATANVPLAFCDASFAPGGKTGFGWRRSRTGVVITLNGGAILWMSRCQTCVAMSTCEAEYVALSQCAQEAVWVRAVLTFLGAPQTEPMRVHEDNEAAAAIANSDAETTIKRTKAVDIRYHYTREKVERGEIKVVPCRTDDMLADILTKCLGPEKQAHFWTMLRGALHAYLR